MEIKTSPPMTVLYSTHRVRMADLAQLAGVVVRELYSEACKNKVLVSGPCYWVYFGADGHPETVFTLEIALPIQGKMTESRFATRELPAFKAAAHVHEAAWEKMGNTYTQLMEYTSKNKHELTGEAREVYLNIDFEHPENNVTEIQLGVKINGLC